MFVSGTKSSRGTTNRGTSVFGGDVVISGSLTDGSGNPITGGGGASAVGWRSGSADNSSLMVGWIHTTGSLVVSGGLHLGAAGASTFSPVIKNVTGSMILANSASAGDIVLVTNAGTSNEQLGIHIDGFYAPDNSRIGLGRVPYGASALTISGSGGGISHIADQISQDAGLSYNQSLIQAGGATSSRIGQALVIVTGSDIAKYTLFQNEGLNSGTPRATAAIWSATNFDNARPGGMVGSFGTLDIHIAQVLAFAGAGSASTVMRPAISITSGTVGSPAGRRNTGSGTQVLILSGGDNKSYEATWDTSASPDPQKWTDTAFFVSGTIGSKDSASVRGTSVFGGDVVVSGNIHAAQYIYHEGDSDTRIGFWDDTITLVAGDKGVVAGVGGVTYLGSAGTEASKHSQVLVLSGGGAASTNEAAGLDVAFYVSGAIDSRSRSGSRGMALFGGDLTTSGALCVAVTGGGTDPMVVIGPAPSSSPMSDTSVWVSGSIGSKDTSTRGTSVFGGDVVASGSLYVNPQRDGGGDLLVAGTTSGPSHLLFADTSADMVGIGTNLTLTPVGVKLDVVGSGSPLVRVANAADSASGGVIRLENTRAGEEGVADDFVGGIWFYAHDDATNDTQYSKITSKIISPTDGAESGILRFAVRHDGEEHEPLIVKGDQVLILSGGSSDSVDPSAGTDVSFYVSGSRNKMGSYGTSVFGGDLFTSGVLYAYGSDSGLPAAAIGNTVGASGIGNDAHMWVSGSIGSKDTSTRGTSVFGGDVVISGTLHGGSPLKIGTDMRLAGSDGGDQYFNFGNTDGSSGYGVRSDAGTMQFKSNGGTWANMGSGAGGGSNGISVVSGSTSTGSVTSINLELLGYVTNIGGGAISVTGTIGQAEEGTYSDGLFSSFDPTTPIGTAIDKINEVLKYLSPSPSPSLDNVNSLQTGLTSNLSFGSSNTITGYTNVGSSAGIRDAVDVNDVYQVVTSSNNIRLATFDGTSAITGVLNSDVAADKYSNSVINYSG